MSVVLEPTSKIGQFVSERNRGRQYDFLHTSFMVSQETDRFPIGKDLVCDLNFYAVQYLSDQPGRYRHDQNVHVGDHQPPDWREVPAEMDLFFENLNESWSSLSAPQLGALAIWGVNYVHPFCEGNGRSARALSYFVICKKINQWLPGSTTVMELIRKRYSARYCSLLKDMDNERTADGMTNLVPMTEFLEDLLLQQIQSVTSDV